MVLPSAQQPGDQVRLSEKASEEDVLAQAA